MRAETLGDVLVHAGLSREEMELGAAVTKFLKSGGTQAAAHAVVDAAAERMPGRGQFENGANSAHPSGAPTRQPVEDGAAPTPLPDEGPLRRAAPSSLYRGGEGQLSIAPKRQMRDALPGREPSQSQRAVAGMIAKATAITVLDTLRIDGRAIGDWTVAEARLVGRTKTREGRILIEASRVVANAPPNALLRDVVKPYELQVIMQKAAEISDAT